MSLPKSPLALAIHIETNLLYLAEFNGIPYSSKWVFGRSSSMQASYLGLRGLKYVILHNLGNAHICSELVSRNQL